MRQQYKQPALVAEPINVAAVGHEVVLFGVGVTCCMTPAAARESGLRLLQAANKAQQR